MAWFRDKRNEKGAPWFVPEWEYNHIKASPDYVEVFPEQEKQKAKKVKTNGNDNGTSGQ